MSLRTAAILLVWYAACFSATSCVQQTCVDMDAVEDSLWELRVDFSVESGPIEYHVAQCPPGPANLLVKLLYGDGSLLADGVDGEGHVTVPGNATLIATSTVPVGVTYHVLQGARAAHPGGLEVSGRWQDYVVFGGITFYLVAACAGAIKLWLDQQYRTGKAPSLGDILLSQKACGAVLVVAIVVDVCSPSSHVAVFLDDMFDKDTWWTSNFHPDNNGQHNYAIYSWVSLNVIYFGINFALMALDFMAPPAIMKYKLQPGVPITVASAWEATKRIFVLHAMMFPLIYNALPLLLLLCAPMDARVPSWPRILAELLFCLFTEDLLHYILHRVMHVRALYKHVHVVHHRYAAPFGMAATYSHPIEFLVLGIPTMGGPFLIGAHFFTLLLWVNWRQLDAIETHCGFDLPFSPCKWIPMWGGAEYHDAHHSLRGANFASTFTFWDALLGTDARYREMDPETRQWVRPKSKPVEGKKNDSPSTSLFRLSDNPSKARGERFFLQWSVVWITIMASIVVTGVYEHFDANTYMTVGVLVGGPCVALPLLFPGEDASIPWMQRYTTKANAWIWVISFIGNYFWTHYFYALLGASYTFPAWRLNDVPFCLFLITHSYFATYHTVSTIILRAFWDRAKTWRAPSAMLGATLLVIAMSYAVALTEAITIQHFPYYEIENRASFYKYGSAFYALYFVVSFPMYSRLDAGGTSWTIADAIKDSLAACMGVSLLVDFWRLTIGVIEGVGSSGTASAVPFL